MSIADLCICISCDAADDPSLAPVRVAVQLGHRFNARVQLVVATAHLEMGAPYGALVSSLVHHENQRVERLARDLEQRAAAIATEASVELRSERVRGAYGDLADQVVNRARVSDLVVVPADRSKLGVGRGLLEAALFTSGRPVLVTTDAIKPSPFSTAVIAWDGSRAAARAVHDALPLLRLATEVVAVNVADDRSQATAREPLLTHLAHHDLRVAWVELTADRSTAAEALLRHCAEHEADLLVMGGYGHTRVRELVLGGVTRAALDQAGLTLLLSH